MRHSLFLLFIVFAPALASAAVETLVETFNGDGPYQSLTNGLVGFDNPGWEVYSDDGFANGGLHLQNDGGYEDTDSDGLERVLTGVGSFRTRIELKNVNLGDFDEIPVDSSGQIAFGHWLDESEDGTHTVRFVLQESLDVQDLWDLSFRASNNRAGGFVPRGDHVAIEIVYNYDLSNVMFSYDPDIMDDVEPMKFGPLKFIGEMQETHLLTIVTSSRSSGEFDGILDFLSVTPLSDIEGDFNGNGFLDAADVDQLSEQVRSDTNDPIYDLNADALVNDLDRQFWVHNLKQMFFGDADLNGSFDSTDLVRMLASGKYEDDVALNSTWITGDWDGDGDFTSGDLVVALADGGYEAGAAAVPEPAGAVLAMTAAALVAIRRRGCAKTRRA